MGELQFAAWSLAEELTKEAGALKPPVAEELRIKGGHEEGGALDGTGEAMELLHPTLQVGGGVLLEANLGLSGVIGLLVLQGAALGRHPMELEPEGAPGADAELLEPFFGKIPAEVAMKFPIGPIPWIPLAGAPNGQGGATVPGEEGHPG
jgi:hypothetical protein